MEVFQAALNADPLQLLLVVGLGLIIAGSLGSVKDWFNLSGQRGGAVVVVGAILTFFAFIDPRILFGTTTSATLEEIKIDNFKFCNQPCSGNGANDLNLFPELAQEIYVSFDYSGMEPGMQYTRVWTHEDEKEEWIHYNCVWQGPENGTFHFSLFERQIEGLRSGDWTITITVEDKVVAQDTVTVAGSYEGWKPAGVKACPDF